MLKTALICSFIGIGLLYFFTQLEMKETSIIDLPKIENSNVLIKGKISSVNIHDKMMFLSIDQERIDSVDVVLFKDSDFELYKGMNVEIVGELMDYQGKKEIIANQVRII